MKIKEMNNGCISVTIFGRTSNMLLQGLTRKTLAIMIEIIKINIKDARCNGYKLQERRAEESLYLAEMRYKSE